MSLEADIRQALAELELISHAPTKNYDGPSRRSSEHPGGKEPPGTDRERPHDLEERMALAESYHGKTVRYYRIRLDRHGPSPELLSEVRETVRCWRVMRVPAGQPPAPGDPQWKRWVADSPLDGGELARLFGVSRQYIHQVRRQYRPDAG